ncbi:MAG: hypothetical protein ACKVRO_19000 [Micropepsaceae bacterium]
MTDTPEKLYPDITEILAQKARGRRERAALSFAEKLDAVDALKARLEPVDRARKARQKDTAPRPSSLRVP